MTVSVTELQSKRRANGLREKEKEEEEVEEIAVIVHRGSQHHLPCCRKHVEVPWRARIIIRHAIRALLMPCTPAAFSLHSNSGSSACRGRQAQRASQCLRCLRMIKSQHSHAHDNDPIDSISIRQAEAQYEVWRMSLFISINYFVYTTIHWYVGVF